MTRKQAMKSVGARVTYRGTGIADHHGELTKLFMGSFEWVARVAFDEGLTLNCRIEDLTLELPGRVSAAATR